MTWPTRICHTSHYGFNCRKRFSLLSTLVPAAVWESDTTTCIVFCIALYRLQSSITPYSRQLRLAPVYGHFHTLRQPHPCVSDPLDLTKHEDFRSRCIIESLLVARILKGVSDNHVFASFSCSLVPVAWSLFYFASIHRCQLVFHLSRTLYVYHGIAGSPAVFRND